MDDVSFTVKGYTTGKLFPFFVSCYVVIFIFIVIIIIIIIIIILFVTIIIFL